MTTSMKTSGAVQVTLAQECDLVTTGFAALMAPYAGRIVVLPSQGGWPAQGADLTLHDSLADVQVLPGVVSEPVPHHGRLVTWTWNARPDLIEMALGIGASGVLSKRLPASALVAAFEAIHAGQTVVDLGDSHPPAMRPWAEQLTPREAEVIAMVTRGLDNKTIAEQASISINSVKSYIRSAYRKIGVSSRSQAVLWGVRHGYVSPASLYEDPSLSA